VTFEVLATYDFLTTFDFLAMFAQIRQTQYSSIFLETFWSVMLFHPETGKSNFYIQNTIASILCFNTQSLM
jgi:hypothetical protein